MQGANQYNHNVVLDVTNSFHPITTGVSDFISPGFQNYGTAKVGATVLGVTGSNPNAAAVATWQYGSGTVVSLAPAYMLSRNGYGNSLDSLESGNGDRLLEQAVNFAANGTSAAVPEPATLTMFGLGALGFAGTALRRRKQAA